MNEEMELERLRALFLSASASDSTRAITIVGSLFLIAIVLWLVRSRSLREEHTPIWIAIAMSLGVVSVVPGMLAGITRFIGAWTASSTIFFLGEVCLVMLCLNFAVRLSRTSVQIQALGQEVAILRATLEASKKGQGKSRG